MVWVESGQDGARKTGIGRAETRVLEGPRAVLRGVRAAVYTEGVSADAHFYHVVLEVDQCGVRLTYVCACFGFRECSVVVPGDKDLDCVRLYAQPREGVAEFGECTRLGEVAGVEENVACWEGWMCVMSVVSVGDADDADVGGGWEDGWSRNGGLCPRVDTVCEEEKRRCSKVVQGSRQSTMYQ